MADLDDFDDEQIAQDKGNFLAIAVVSTVVLMLGCIFGLTVFFKRRRAASLAAMKKKEVKRPLFNLKPGPTGPGTPPRCANCGVLGSEAAKEARILEGCPRCKEVFFCCRPCQKTAWKWHKSECKAAPEISDSKETGGSSEAAGDLAASAKKRASLAKKDADASTSLSKAITCLQEATAALAGGEVKRSRIKADESWKAAKKAKETVELQGEALNVLGQACLHLGDTTAADNAYSSMVELGKEAGSAAIEGQGLIGRGQSASRQKGGEEKAVVHHEGAIKLARNAADSYTDDVMAMEIAARGSRGKCLAALGRLEEAVGELRQVVTLRRLAASASENPERKRRLGHALVDQAAMVGNMAPNEKGTGGKQAALAIVREAIVVAKEAGDSHLLQIVKANLRSLKGGPSDDEAEVALPSARVESKKVQ